MFIKLLVETAVAITILAAFASSADLPTVAMLITAIAGGAIVAAED
jgi:hypothetical protein